MGYKYGSAALDASRVKPEGSARPGKRADLTCSTVSAGAFKHAQGKLMHDNLFWTHCKENCHLNCLKPLRDKLNWF